MKKTAVIIPAFNEENSVGKVIDALPKEWVQEIIVVNNNSNDRTEEVARSAGATVLREEEQGYGAACLKGMEYIASKSSEEQPELLAFIDADFSDYPEELPLLIRRLEEGYDLVIGSRALGKKEKGAMMPHQRFGNWLATFLIRYLFGVRFTDLGPFRVIRYDKLLALEMKDRNYGWTVEMQVKAAKMKLRCSEVAVSYRKRIGKSKVTGTVKGSLGAGYKIIYTIIKSF